MREGFRLAVDHASDCWLKDAPYPFVMHDGVDWGLNKNGVGKGGWSFERFLCNDSHCPAILRVRVDVLSKWLGTGDEHGL